MTSPTENFESSQVLRSIGGGGTFQRGLSLIELMISITLGLLILASLTALFVNQSKTRSELDKSNRMIDNGRYALEVLSDSLRMAGYYGEFAPASGIPAIPGALPDPCSTTSADIAAALQLAVQGYEADGETGTISSPPCGFTYTAGSALTLKPGSDIVVIRRASTVTPPIPVASGVTGTNYLQVSLCQFDATPFMVDTTIANLTLRQRNCVSGGGAPYAGLREMVVQVYFVSPNNSPADGIPTLKRYELNPVDNTFRIMPLVEGIEHMQIDYGLDTSGDGAADSFIEAPTATQWPDVVAATVHLLARNTEPTGGHNDTKTYSLGLAGPFGPKDDKYKRHAYTQFIRLVNPAGRREVPP